MAVFKTGFDVVYGFGENRPHDSFAINNGVSSASAGSMFEFLSLRYIENYGGLRNGYRLQIGRIIDTKSHYAPVKKYLTKYYMHDWRINEKAAGNRRDWLVDLKQQLKECIAKLRNMIVIDELIIKNAKLLGRKNLSEIYRFDLRSN